MYLYLYYTLFFWLGRLIEHKNIFFDNIIIIIIIITRPERARPPFSGLLQWFESFFLFPSEVKNECIVRSLLLNTKIVLIGLSYIFVFFYLKKKKNYVYFVSR